MHKSDFSKVYFYIAFNFGMIYLGLFPIQETKINYLHQLKHPFII